jgi:hypothetical protein
MNGLPANSASDTEISSDTLSVASSIATSWSEPPHAPSINAISPRPINLLNFIAFLPKLSMILSPAGLGMAPAGASIVRRLDPRNLHAGIIGNRVCI